MKICCWIICLIVVGALAASAAGVVPKLWRHGSEADFVKCLRKNTVVNSHGDVTLARKIKILMPSGKAPTVVSAVAVGKDGKTVYAASGTDGKIYKIADGKIKSWASIPATIVTCLVKRGGVLLAGGGGKGAGIYQIDKAGKVKKLFADKAVKYVWAILPAGEDVLYAATGPEAKVFRIRIELDGNAKAEVIYQAGKKLARNILCLAADKAGKKNIKKLFAGTDKSGLVIEIDPQAKTARVILDAAEKEISALLTDGSGGLFAATSDAARAAGADKTAGIKNGKAPRSGKSPRPGKSGPATQPATDQAVGSAGAGKTGQKKRNVPAVASKGADGRVILTLPAGQKLPVVLHEGKKLVLIRDVKTGKVQKVPLNEVCLRHTAAAKPKAQAVGPGKKHPMLKKAGKKPKSVSTPKSTKKGNAVYYIDPAGMVRTVFRRVITIQAMLAQGERLILATGNEGRIYYVTTDGMMSGQLIDTDAKQVTALAQTAGGDLIFATSNTASVGRISNTFAATGAITSKPMDAKQIAQWGTLKLTGLAPKDTAMTVATRSGNLAEAQDDTWSDWSKEFPLEEGFLPICAPAGRFLQYRATFTSDGAVTPSLGSVQVIYQVGNLAPSVNSITVKPASKGTKPTQSATSQVYRHVAIQASDPNGDKLEFTVQYRPLSSDAWVEITDELKAPKYVWDTRTVPDGKYELRITACDSLSNTSAAALSGTRISEPIVVDNTTPLFKSLGAKLKGQAASIRGTACDRTSRIVSMQYSVNSTTKWKTFLPADGICDSATEQFSFETEPLEPGAHLITVRAKDTFGNVGYAALNVTVGK